MAVTRPPVAKPNKALEEFVNKGGSTAVKDQPERKEIAVNIRLKPEELERVDEVVRCRRTIPRHSWLLEAIFEKLAREEGKV